MTPSWGRDACAARPASCTIARSRPRCPGQGARAVGSPTTAAEQGGSSAFSASSPFPPVSSSQTSARTSRPARPSALVRTAAIAFGIPALLYLPWVPTVVFLGASVSQLSALRQARSGGLRVVAVDGDPTAVGFAEADVHEAVDFTDVDRVSEISRREHADAVAHSMTATVPSPHTPSNNQTGANSKVREHIPWPTRTH